jgi:hypothetical protein
MKLVGKKLMEILLIVIILIVVILIFIRINKCEKQGYTNPCNNSYQNLSYWQEIQCPYPLNNNFSCYQNENTNLAIKDNGNNTVQLNEFNKSNPRDTIVLANNLYSKNNINDVIQAYMYSCNNTSPVPTDGYPIIRTFFIIDSSIIPIPISNPIKISFTQDGASQYISGDFTIEFIINDKITSYKYVQSQNNSWIFTNPKQELVNISIPSGTNNLLLSWADNTIILAP